MDRFYVARDDFLWDLKRSINAVLPWDEFLAANVRALTVPHGNDLIAFLQYLLLQISIDWSLDGHICLSKKEMKEVITFLSNELNHPICFRQAVFLFKSSPDVDISTFGVIVVGGQLPITSRSSPKMISLATPQVNYSGPTGQGASSKNIRICGDAKSSTSTNFLGRKRLMEQDVSSNKRAHLEEFSPISVAPNDLPTISISEAFNSTSCPSNVMPSSSNHVGKRIYEECTELGKDSSNDDFDVIPSEVPNINLSDIISQLGISFDSCFSTPEHREIGNIPCLPENASFCEGTYFVQANPPVEIILKPVTDELMEACEEFSKVYLAERRVLQRADNTTPILQPSERKVLKDLIATNIKPEDRLRVANIMARNIKIINLYIKIIKKMESYLIKPIRILTEPL